MTLNTIYSVVGTLRPCWDLPRATSYMRLKAHDHCILRYLNIGRKGWDRLCSLHTRRWSPKGPKKISWMKSLLPSSQNDCPTPCSCLSQNYYPRSNFYWICWCRNCLAHQIFGKEFYINKINKYLIYDNNVWDKKTPGGRTIILGWREYIDSYIANYKECITIYRKLR